MTLVLQVWLVVGCLYWLLASAMAVRTLQAVPMLASLSPPDPARWPRLSVIIPARDEAATLEAAMASKLGETYPDLEIVLVDDRSTDATGAIVDRLAATDPRVRALHVTELPAGWLGKLNAMREGMEAATGELLLFTDADVHFVPGTLARAVAHLEARGVEHLALLPSFQGASFLVDTVICVTTRLIASGARAWAVEDPQSSAFLGVGAFNLVRRRALERTPGLEWLRLEVADDLGLGLLLKTHGARTCLVNGRGFVSVVWYPTLGGYARGAARAGFAAIGGFSAARLLAWAFAVLLLESAPFCAVVFGGAP
jgi:cellulose synthase/poly-beta-1,6-N-acetylglucosamine synthase-like glycosyltransferase